MYRHSNQGGRHVAAPDQRGSPALHGPSRVDGTFTADSAGAEVAAVVSKAAGCSLRAGVSVIRFLSIRATPPYVFLLSSAPVVGSSTTRQASAIRSHLMPPDECSRDGTSADI